MSRWRSLSHRQRQRGQEEEGDLEWRYQCCCGCCMARTGTLVIIVFDTMLVGVRGMQLLFAQDRYLNSGYTSTVFYAQLMIVATLLSAIVAGYVSLGTEKPHLLLPYLVWRYVQTVITVAVLFFSVACFFFGSKWLLDRLSYLYNEDIFEMMRINYDMSSLDLHRIWTVMMTLMTVSSAISVAVSIWIVTVVRSCYQAFLDKQRFRKNARLNYCHPSTKRGQYAHTQTSARFIHSYPSTPHKLLNGEALPMRTDLNHNDEWSVI